MVCPCWSLVLLAGAILPAGLAPPGHAAHRARPSEVCEGGLECSTNGAHRSPAPGQTMRDTLIDVGGYRLHFRIAAGPTAGPVVVLDAGGGLDADEWRSVQTRLARETGATTVSYDRAGFGSSDLPTTPFDFRREVEGLHTGLSALGFAGHVILVGHSYAGLTLQLYAAMFHSTVDGLLFVDPNSPSFVLAMGGPAGLVNAPGQHLPFDTAGQLTKEQAATVHQMKSFATTIDLVAAAPLPPSIPVIVLTAGRPWWPVPRQNRAFRASHELLANSVDDGTLIVAERSGHMIPESRPDLIVTSVQTLLQKHRRS